MSRVTPWKVRGVFLNWEIINLKKSEWRLSIRKYFYHNYAMFAKIIWRLLSELNAPFFLKFWAGNISQKTTCLKQKPWVMPHLFGKYY